MNASLCDAPKSNGNTLEPNATQVICATRSHTKLRPHFCIATNHSGQFERLNWGDAIEAMTWKFASSDNHKLKRNLLKESQCWCSHWHHDVYTADVLILNINNNGSEDNITIHGLLQACTITHLLAPRQDWYRGKWGRKSDYTVSSGNMSAQHSSDRSKLPSF